MPIASEKGTMNAADTMPTKNKDRLRHRLYLHFEDTLFGCYVTPAPGLRIPVKDGRLSEWQSQMWHTLKPGHLVADGVVSPVAVRLGASVAESLLLLEKGLPKGSRMKTPPKPGQKGTCLRFVEWYTYLTP
jgi:hypothetical protein